MATENKEIGEFVRKSKILLLDIEGTTTSISFVKDKLFPYAEENVKKFLEDQWEQDDVKNAVNALRKLALEDKEKSVDGVITIPGEDASKEDQIEGLVNNVKWQMSSDRKAGPLKQLQGLIWKQGYDNGDIKGHVYDDVSSALEKWHAVDGQKVYIYSSGSVQAQKLLFGQSLAGDLLKYIDGHFDTAVGSKQESSSYTSIIEKIGCSPEDVLFLTDITKEAEAARSAGLHVALVCREGNAELPKEASDYPVIHSLEQLTVSNKRKTDPQDADQPAKIPKTEGTNDKESKPELKTIETTVSEDKTELEKMEVEEVAEEPKEENLMKEKTKGEEIPDSSVLTEEPTDMQDSTKTICDIEAAVIKSDDVTDKKENDKMEIGIKDIEDNSENNKTDSKDKKSSDSSETETSEPESKISAKSPEMPNEKVTDVQTDAQGPITKETIVIEEVTNDKESTCEVADIIEGIEPIVEEPMMNDDIEDLQNVGDVLEKECDEILSKVQDVTNLDNISIKPLLNPIVEESMETENTDSNDIVDRILDTELEMELKQSAEIVKSVEVDNLAEITEVSEKTETGVTKETADNITLKDTTDNKIENSESTDVIEQTNSESKEISNETEESKDSVVEPESSSDHIVTENEKPESETKPVEANSNTAQEELTVLESETEGGCVNGNTTNGETEAKQNGDSKDEELKSRLSAENGEEVDNGKEVVNGANGNATNVENGVVEKKTETEATEIKVKTVATEGQTTELIEQSSEA